MKLTKLTILPLALGFLALANVSCEKKTAVENAVEEAVESTEEAAAEVEEAAESAAE